MTIICVLTRLGGERIELREFPAVIGRAADLAVRIEDPRSSRRHAVLEEAAGGLQVRDLESGNGTYLNGLRIASARISPSDEIRIGDSKWIVEEIHVELDSEARTSVAPEQEPESEPEPQSVETVPALSATAATAAAAAPSAATATGRPIPRVSARIARRKWIGRIVPAILLLSLGSLALAWVLWAPRDPGNGTARGSTGIALDALGALRREAAGLPNVTRELLARAEALRNRTRGEAPPGSVDPALQFLDALRTRQKLEVSQRAASLEAELRGLVEEGAHSKALERATRETEALREECPALTEALARIRDDTVKAVRRTYGAKAAEIRFLADFAREGEALAAAEAVSPIFQGTPHAAELETTIHDLRGRIAAEDARRLEALAKLDAQAEAATRAESGKPAARKATPGLAERLAEAVRLGKLKGRKYRLPSGFEGAPAEVESGTRVRFDGAAGSESIDLAGAPAELIASLALEALEGDSLFDAARAASRARLAKPMGALLHRFVSEKALSAEEKARRKEKTDRLLAAARGLDGVPEGGFSYTPDWGWEDARQTLERKAVEGASKHARSLSSASTQESAAKAFASIEAVLADAALSPGTKAAVRTETIAAVETLRGKLAQRLRREMSSSGFAALRIARAELDKRRAAALKLIFDTSRYLPEDHPDWPKGDRVNGQEEVDKAVGAVRELWENTADYTVTLGRSTRKTAAFLAAVDAWLSEKLHREVAKAGREGLEDVFDNLSEKLDLRRYAASKTDAERFAYNRKVDDYNAKLVDPEIPEADRAHVAWLNDYREMLGLRRLFIEARLCRATRKHSAACNEAGRIWHVGPDGSPGSRAQAEGFGGGVAENIAMGYANPRDIWTRGWYRASDHHRNALGSGHTCIGYGYVGQVGTQNFASIGAPFR